MMTESAVPGTWHVIKLGVGVNNRGFQIQSVSTITFEDTGMQNQ